MLKRILVSLGGSEYASVAIRRGIELAERHGARLTGVTVADVRRLRRVGPVAIGGGEEAHRLREHRLETTRKRVEEAIDEFETACRAAGVEYGVRREQGDPFQLMISCARYHDLMICGLRSVFEYGELGDDDYEPSRMLSRLIGGSARPLIANSDEYRPIRRVQIAYSGSVESAKTMKRFVQFRLWPEMTLRIVTFCRSEEDGRRCSADAVEYCRVHGFEPEVQRYSGKPHKGLLSEAADWKADMIVLGTPARSLLARRVFGETALHVIRGADRPLFLGP
jgi:nucleotide-binding universal stress UspA family protein